MKKNKSYFSFCVVSLSIIFFSSSQSHCVDTETWPHTETTDVQTMDDQAIDTQTINVQTVDNQNNKEIIYLNDLQQTNNSTFNHLKMVAYGLVLGSLSATACYFAEKTNFPLFWCPISWYIFYYIRKELAKSIAYSSGTGLYSTLNLVARVTDWVVYIALRKKYIQELLDSKGTINIKLPLKNLTIKPIKIK